MSILAQRNRNESLNKLGKEGKRIARKTQILAVLSDVREPLTAKEIGIQLGFPKIIARDKAQPRIKDLMKDGLVEEVEANKYDNDTNRNVTAYVLAGERI